MRVELDYWESQIVYFTKRWFDEKTTLKQIVAERNGIEEKDLEGRDVVEALIELMKGLPGLGHGGFSWDRVLVDTIYGKEWRRQELKSPEERFVEIVVEHLGAMPIRNESVIVGMQSPDFGRFGEKEAGKTRQRWNEIHGGR